MEAIFDFGLAKTLMAIHYIPMLIAVVIWATRDVSLSILSRIADVLGLFGLLIAVCLFFAISDDRVRGADLYPAAAYLMLSVSTAGILPILSVSLHWLAGRLIGKGVRGLVVSYRRNA
ncbi:hypothetical protein [Phyllobacterium myrsinacearum]|uniref:hypothetical protein n=1 Tax=Phyllobacterium myrsinacearum TaxID=28101 RepID=UPI001029260A|nr:hypothetical protein [Phyllobacterium myrsinacearum]